MLGSMDTSFHYDLQDLLGEGARCTGSYISAKDLVRSDFHLLIEKKFVAFPESLHRHYNNVQCRSYMGLFPEIRRAWLAVDNILYLWDYEINEYEIACQLEHVITAVALIKPPEGLYLEAVHYLMVVSTVATVYIFAVETEQKPLLKRFPVRLRDVQYDVPADGASFRCIVGTLDGRIFLGGQDGHVHELQYQSPPSFLNPKRKLRKKNHTKTLMEAFAPSIFMKFISYFSKSFIGDAVLNLVYDPEREWMYVHHESDCLQLMNVANGSFEIGPCITDIANGVHTLCVASPITDRRVMKIISLHPIQHQESRNICLVAITNTDCRLYFSVQCTMGTRTPVSIKLEYVRLPPTRDITHSLAQPPKPLDKSIAHSIPDLRLPLTNFITNAHTAFYSRGLMLSANSVSDTGDSLLCTSIDFSSLRTMLPLREYPKERAHVMHLDGRTWDLRELDPETTLPLTSFDSEENKPRHFILLSQEGIRILSKQRPLDELIYLLRLELRDLHSFVDLYGQDQVCAWLLAILCNNLGTVHPSLLPNEAGFNVNLAKHHFFTYGGSPIRQPTLQRQVDLGKLVTPSTLQHSGCFRGLELYTKRLIAPFWKHSILLQKGHSFDLGISEPTLQKAQLELTKLIQFTNEWHPPNDLFMDRHGIDSTHTWLQEKPFLVERFQLNQLILEAIHFVLILIRMRLPEVASTLLASHKEIPTELTSAPFEYLVTDQGRMFCGQVATFLVQHAPLSYPTESLSPQFKDHCPTLLHMDDIYTAMVLEKLELPNPTNNVALYEDALQIALKVAGKLKSRPFLKLCDKFSQLGFVRGVLDLSLQRAMELDLEDVALTYLEEGKPSTQDPRSLILAQRQECYTAILKAFDELNQRLAHPSLSSQVGRQETTTYLESQRTSTHARALESHDKLWHFALYEWYANQSKVSILDLKTPFLEEWLNSVPMVDPMTTTTTTSSEHESTTTTTHGGLSMFEKQKLLSQYYVLQKKFDQASFVLFHLALAVSEDLPLHERIDFLKQASQTVKASNDTELQLKIRDYLDVALVQQSLSHQVPSSSILATPAILDLQTLYTIAEEHGLVASQLRLLAMSEAPESFSREELIQLWKAVFDSYMDNDLNDLHMNQMEAQFNEVLSGYANSGSPIYAPSIWVPAIEELSFRLRLVSDFQQSWWLLVAVERCQVDIEAIFMALKVYVSQLPEVEREKRAFVVKDMVYCLELWKKHLPLGFDSSVWESARASALVFAGQLDMASLFVF